MNGWNQLDHCRRWIAARGRSQPEMDHDGRWIPSRYWSQLDMDAWLEVADRRCISGDESWEMDDNQSPFLYNDIEVMWLYTLLEIMDFDFKSWGLNGMQLCMYTMYCRRGSTEYNTEHYSEHRSEHYSEHLPEQYSKIPNYAATCPSSNAEYDPKSDPTSHSDTVDTAHLDCVWGKSPAKQWSLKRGMTVPDSQNPYCEQFQYRKCRNNAQWDSFNNREG